MAINKNHEFEDLNGIKCAVVEKNIPDSRVRFLKELLELNGYTVVVVDSPPPKPAPPPKQITPTPTTDQPATTNQQSTVSEQSTTNNQQQATSNEQPATSNEKPPPPTFTLGVTDVTFNPTNAIFGRLLKTKKGKVVSLAYWQQKEEESRDDIPYFENKANGD